MLAGHAVTQSILVSLLLARCCAPFIDKMWKGPRHSPFLQEEYLITPSSLDFFYSLCFLYCQRVYRAQREAMSRGRKKHVVAADTGPMLSVQPQVFCEISLLSGVLWSTKLEWTEHWQQSQHHVPWVFSCQYMIVLAALLLWAVSQIEPDSWRLGCGSHGHFTNPEV